MLRSSKLVDAVIMENLRGALPFKICCQSQGEHDRRGQAPNVTGNV